MTRTLSQEKKNGENSDSFAEDMDLDLAMSFSLALDSHVNIADKIEMNFRLGKKNPRLFLSGRCARRIQKA